MIQKLVTDLFDRLKGDGLEAKILRDTGNSLITKTSGMGISFLLQLVLARVLGVEEYGNYVYVVSWMITLSLFGTLGFGQAAIRYVADYKTREASELLRGYIQRASQFVTGLSAIFVLIVAVVVGLLSTRGILEKEVAAIFLYASPLLLLLALLDLQTGILRGADYLTHALILQMVAYPLGIAIAVIASSLLLPSPIGARAAIAIHGFVLLIIIVFQNYFIRRALPVGSSTIMPRYLTGEWLGTSTSMWTSQASQNFIRRLDILAVGTLIGTREAGIYAIAGRLVQLLDLGLQVTNLASAHRFATLQSLGMKKELQRVVFLTTKMSFLSTFPLALILFLGADRILLLFGEDFIGGMPILKILIFGEIVLVLSGPNVLLLNMTGHHKELARIYVFSLILDVGFMLLLFSYWGVLGIAAASALTIMFRNIVAVLRVRQRLGVNSTIFSSKAWVASRG